MLLTTTATTTTTVAAIKTTTKAATTTPTKFRLVMATHHRMFGAFGSHNPQVFYELL